ncbi:amino acid deaminase/aldolase [Pseudofrankia sp. BMG5.37]|nr:MULTISPECIES: amino acid deaminase/aldolase [unclassified Pseudofrankia]MDT3439638.1 amino acid deaminase/aldolase [Pseudofrankia sp. BMG5.37]OHV42837.1 alanine racemase [Pseudofrankia sp. BMG5.36]
MVALENLVGIFTRPAVPARAGQAEPPPQPPQPDWDRLAAATAALDPPFAVVDLPALRANAADLVRRAAGKPIRVASKSVRSRAVLRAVLATDGFAGILAYTLPEAIWLAEEFHDVVVGYPTADRAALRTLADHPLAASRVTLMIDSVEQLDLIDAVLGAARPPLRVCIDLDASLRLAAGRVHLGVRRSPVHTAEQAGELAKAIATRPGFALVGLMGYEAQIAGMGDAPPPPLPPAEPADGSGSGSAPRLEPARRAAASARAEVVRRMQARSMAELAARRAAAVAAVREVAPGLEFVNGGGTGSVHLTTAEAAVTEIAAGSGLYGPTLFDIYQAFTPAPAAFFALPVVRRPAPGIVTVAGGGWIASGPAGPDRVPRPVHPAGLRMIGTEGAGEVQTPLRGPAADTLRIGDRVWFRHAKAGELCEHVNALHLVDADGSIQAVPTYRGEGRAF